MEITISPPAVPPKVIYGPPPLAGAPPSYSAIMRLGTYDLLSSNARRRGIPIQPSPPFVAPAPPPSYAEAEGFYAELEVASGNLQYCHYYRCLGTSKLIIHISVNSIIIKNARYQAFKVQEKLMLLAM